MLPDIQINDEWKIVRLGADIGLECLGCGHRVMLSRRELAHRVKTIQSGGTSEDDTK
jgi:hypothetical protein